MNHFQHIILDHYGTMKQFKDDMKINHVTAARYLRDPDRMQVRFVKRLSKQTGIPVTKLIGEGEE